MKFGWPISIFLHTALLLAGLLVFSTGIETPDTKRVIPVDILTVEELTNIGAAVQKPKDKTPPAETAEDPPMTLKTPAPHAPDEGEAHEKTPEEMQKQVTTQSAETDPDAQPETKPKDQAKPEPEEFDLNKYAALIDKARASQPEAGQQQALQSETNFYVYADEARRSAGAGTGLSISEIDLLRAAMYKCWRIPLDAKNPEQLSVRVKVSLRMDGSVREVQLLEQSKIAASPNPYMLLAAQRAVNAVSKCAPYDFLPPEKYSNWQDMTLHFQPEI